MSKHFMENDKGQFVPVPPLDNNEPNSEYWAQRAEAQATMVTWTLDLEDAEALWDYLHHNRPGGHQYVHDSLREAIARTKALRDE